MDVDVTVVAQAADREVDEIVVRRAESYVEGLTPAAVFAPGTKLRLERKPGECNVTPPVSRDEGSLIVDTLDCALPSGPDEGDDELLVRGRRQIGERWAMSKRALSRAIGTDIGDAAQGTVELLRVERTSAHVRASYSAPRHSGELTYELPADPSVPIPRYHGVFHRPLGQSGEEIVVHEIKREPR